jgi:anti-sigma B factor antagonist
MQRPEGEARDMEQQDFRIDVVRADEDATVLRVAGEIDLCSSFSFREQLSRAAEGDAAQVVLDLSDVRLIDSTGLSVLAGIARRLFLEARELVLICPESRLRRVLSTTGLDRLVPVVEAQQDLMQRRTSPSAASPRTARA